MPNIWALFIGWFLLKVRSIRFCNIVVEGSGGHRTSYWMLADILVEDDFSRLNGWYLNA